MSKKIGHNVVKKLWVLVDVSKDLSWQSMSEKEKVSLV